MAAMYAVYHGPSGLKRIAGRVHLFTQLLKAKIESLGFQVVNGAAFFDTLTVRVGSTAGDVENVHRVAGDAGINLRRVDGECVGVTLDESVTPSDLVDLINVFAAAAGSAFISLPPLDTPIGVSPNFPLILSRRSEYLSHPVFNTHHSETEMLRYLNHLQGKDLSLVHAMIPLGSCTMKLNGTSNMIPLTWPEFARVHPFVPVEQAKGYSRIIKVGRFICNVRVNQPTIWG